MRNRTEQDLLAERRANVQEMRVEHDATARALLQYHCDQIDAELIQRRERWVEIGSEVRR